jgi:predicted nucleotidyltransferase
MIELERLAGNSEIRSAWLFGSRARGDFDEFSDTDVVLFSEPMQLSEMVLLKRRLTEQMADDTISLSLYSVPSTEAMAKGGSLFLWHVKLEGREIFSRGTWFNHILEALAPYSRERAVDDLVTLRTVLSDVESSLCKSEDTLIFEAATTFTILRNVGNIGMARLGRPAFGRLTPILSLAQYLGERFPLSRAEVERLVEAKLALSQKAAFRGWNWTGPELLNVAKRVQSVWNYVWEETCTDSCVS